MSMPVSSPSVRITQCTNIHHVDPLFSECARCCCLLLSVTEVMVSLLESAAHARAHVRAARWTFLAHASSKHSPEHHPSSALIDAGRCFTRAAKKLVWSAAATSSETYSGIVPARHPAPRLFESGEETVPAELGSQQLHSLTTRLHFSATPSPVASARVSL